MSSRSNSWGIPSVTWSIPISSPMFGTEKSRSTSAPVCTCAGLIERCADAGAGAASTSTPTAQTACTRGLKPKVTRDHHALDLVRPLAYLEDLLVAVQARDRVLVHEAVTAVDLEPPVRGAVRQLPGEQLRHRGDAAEVPPLVLLPRRPVDEPASRLDLRSDVDELLLHRLELRDRPPELLALLRVRER